MAKRGLSDARVRCGRPKRETHTESAREISSNSESFINQQPASQVISFTEVGPARVGDARKGSRLGWDSFGKGPLLFLFSSLVVVLLWEWECPRRLASVVAKSALAQSLGSWMLPLWRIFFRALLGFWNCTRFKLQEKSLAIVL
ncbi:hypothetical protein CDAR_450741 [Caerostris darwini]|uniref:Uncharacterized protein n=1 Tax=Caerostris darwini TaxID=1538125 RepID=A0AAV4TQN8_9ARAC|nr:hypothetical protein CDAR_450741 [Caerostris darwini]